LRKATSFLIFTFLFCFNLFGQTISKSVFVVNSVANTLSVLDMSRQILHIDTLSPGPNSMPNHLVLNNGRGYIVNSGINNISVFEMATLQMVNTIALPNASNPWSMDFINDSLAAVSLWMNDQLVIVNVNKNQIVETIGVGTSPEGVKYYNGKIYVANSGYVNYTLPYEPGSVSVIDIETFTNTGSIPVAINPQDLDIDSQGRLLVACTGDYVTSSGQLDIVDLNLDSVVSCVNISSGISTVNVNAGDKAYLATYGFGVMVYDLISESFEISGENLLPGGPGVDFDAEDNAYIVDFGDGQSAGALRIYTSSHQELNSYIVNVGPICVVVYDPDISDIFCNENNIANKAVLYPNYPNPFNPNTTIHFSLPIADNISLNVYDVLGRRIKNIYKGYLVSGTHIFNWNGVNDYGIAVPSGIYFYQLRTGNHVITRQMHYIK
jgi:hypothetical protein